jgi:hypothetical protein
MNREKIPIGHFVSTSFFTLAAPAHASLCARLIQKQEARRVGGLVVRL